MTPPIWQRLVGQQHVVDELARAVHDANAVAGAPGQGMTHAWLITGPPGSGRSTAATCFAAALACPDDGCGACSVCRGVPLGAFSDVEIHETEGVNYSIDDARALVQRSSMAPTENLWHVMIVEDADRIREEAEPVLLKAIEEPPPHTVWILCAPSTEDITPTIASRTRHVALSTPTTADVTRLLIDAYGVDHALATFAARASQGHIGRARALAQDEHARRRRLEVMRLPFGLQDLGSCIVAAANLLAAATEDQKSITDPLDEAELQQLQAQYGEPPSPAIRARIKRLASSENKDLLARQKRRHTRVLRDQVDRALLDLLGLFRDVLVIQLGAPQELVNEEMRPQLEQLAARSTPVDTTRRLRAISYRRGQMAANTSLQILLEALMVELRDPSMARSA